jgi:hypothetical protein
LLLSQTNIFHIFKSHSTFVLIITKYFFVLCCSSLFLKHQIYEQKFWGDEAEKCFIIIIFGRFSNHWNLWVYMIFVRWPWEPDELFLRISEKLFRKTFKKALPQYFE